MAKIQAIGVKCSALIFLDHPRPGEPSHPPQKEQLFLEAVAIPLGKDLERPLGKETGIHNSVVSAKVGFPGSEHLGLGCVNNKMPAVYVICYSEEEKMMKTEPLVPDSRVQPGKLSA